MSVITSENRDGWQTLANSFTEQFPSVGKTVKVVDGRKNKNIVGEVIRHIVDKYYSTRYCSGASLMMMQMEGREGYCVQIRTEDNQTFWVKANYVEVLKTE